ECARDTTTSPSRSTIQASNASQRRAALATTASSTAWMSVGELEMTLNISEVAVCWSNASSSARVRTSSCFFNSISELGPLPTCALAFVPVERGLRSRVGLFAPLSDKVTSSAQSLVPLPVGPAKDRAYQSYQNRTMNSRLLTRSPRRHGRAR